MAIEKATSTSEDAAKEFIGWVDQCFSEARDRWCQGLFTDTRLSSVDVRSEEFRRKSCDLYYAALVTLGLSELNDITQVPSRIAENISSHIYRTLSGKPEVYHYVRDFVEHGPGSRFYEEMKAKFPQMSAGWTLVISCRILRHLDLDCYKDTRHMSEDEHFIREMSSIMLGAGVKGYWRIFLKAFEVRNANDAAESTAKPRRVERADGFLARPQLALAAALAVIVSIMLGMNF